MFLASVVEKTYFPLKLISKMTLNHCNNTRNGFPGTNYTNKVLQYCCYELYLVKNHI